MELIRSYTISSIKDIELLPFLQRAQFTLNGRLSPLRRNTKLALSKIDYKNTDVFIHYDFIRTIPRYCMMRKESQFAMINEIVNILEASIQYPNIKGIVIHMDNALRKDMLSSIYGDYNYDEFKKIVSKYCVSTMFSDVDSLTDILYHLYYRGDKLNSQFLVEINRESLVQFNADIQREINRRNLSDINAKIFLENTTHVLKSELLSQQSIAGTLENNYTLISNLDTNLFGLCWDTEHSFASNGPILNTHDLEFYGTNIPFLVHLNAIESGVKQGSFKDLHSKTTVFECTKFSYRDYYDFIEVCSKLNVPYIREVKSDTMERELEQQNRIFAN